MAPRSPSLLALLIGLASALGACSREAPVNRPDRQGGALPDRAPRGRDRDDRARKEGRGPAAHLGHHREGPRRRRRRGREGALLIEIDRELIEAQAAEARSRLEPRKVERPTPSATAGARPIWCTAAPCRSRSTSAPKRATRPRGSGRPRRGGARLARGRAQVHARAGADARHDPRRPGRGRRRGVGGDDGHRRHPAPRDRRSGAAAPEGSGRRERGRARRRRCSRRGSAPRRIRAGSSRAKCVTSRRSASASRT